MPAAAHQPLIGHIEKATGRRAEIRSTGEPADETPLADAESRVMVLDRVRSLGVRFENLREWLHKSTPSFPAVTLGL